MQAHFLGNLSPTQFLREYWQKKPLLIRQAFPGFQGFLDKTKLIKLACQDDTESRLIQYYKNEWSLENGPFVKRDFAHLADKWTLLVQNVNHFFEEGAELLKAFNFISYARLDDVMVSYAADGSGVGPHVDSYDVFLLQGQGKRLWQISNQEDQRFVPDVPLRILKHFKPQQEWILEPGDMLYLPPHYAHNGIAVGDCMTYSIGFRAPSHQELAKEFLIHLIDEIHLEGRYQDPNVKATKSPAQIPHDMLNKVSSVIKKINFDKNEIERFLGKYLTSPKSTVFFEPIEAPVSKKEFFKKAQSQGVKLNLKTQMLFAQKEFFINGEVFILSDKERPSCEMLANHREMHPTAMDIKEIGNHLYEWYTQDFLQLKMGI
jgi:50S ribosomal protein L16 3-hydroxylase